MNVDAKAIEAALQSLAPQSLDVRDDSHLHAGHAGAQEGRHFSVQIVTTRFSGLSRVQRHRLVYDCVQALIGRGGIHALAIDARAPGEA